MAKIDEKLDKIEAKLDKALDHLASIDVTVGKQQVSLEEHMHRTELLEEEVKGNSAHANKIIGAVKFVKLIGVLAAIAEALHIVLH